MPRNSTVGQVYLLHFDRPLKHARHYLGWAIDAISRDDEHEKPWDRVKILAECRRQGIGWSLVRIWDKVTRAFERQLKQGHGAARLCPLCKDDYNQKAREGMRRSRQRRKEQIYE